jgi:hypothetical protein
VLPWHFATRQRFPIALSIRIPERSCRDFALVLPAPLVEELRRLSA